MIQSYNTDGTIATVGTKLGRVRAAGTNITTP